MISDRADRRACVNLIAAAGATLLSDNKKLTLTGRTLRLGRCVPNVVLRRAAVVNGGRRRSVTADLTITQSGACRAFVDLREEDTQYRTYHRYWN